MAPRTLLSLKQSHFLALGEQLSSDKPGNAGSNNPYATLLRTLDVRAG